MANVMMRRLLQQKRSIAIVVDEFGGTASRLVVFGDNLNDLPMLAEADLAVAVGNALPAVKEAADIVIEPDSSTPHTPSAREVPLQHFLQPRVRLWRRKALFRPQLPPAAPAL